MNLYCCISHGSIAFLDVVKDFMLFTKCGEDGGECAHKEFIDGVGKGYGFVVYDNCGVILFMESMVMLCL